MTAERRAEGRAYQLGKIENLRQTGRRLDFAESRAACGDTGCRRHEA